jgi:hypothetical protein
MFIKKERPTPIMCLVDNRHTMEYKDESDGFEAGFYCTKCEYVELDTDLLKGEHGEALLCSQLQRKVK